MRYFCNALPPTLLVIKPSLAFILFKLWLLGFYLHLLCPTIFLLCIFDC